MSAQVGLWVPIRPRDDTRAATPAQALTQDPASTVRAQAAHMLGQVEDLQSVAALAQALSAVLAQDPDPVIRRQAAISLRHVQSEQARAALAAAVADPNPLVRQAVTSALPIPCQALGV